MNNTDIVDMLSKGYSAKEISVVSEIPIHSLRKKILILRKRCLCKSVAQLVAVYIRKGLIS